MTEEFTASGFVRNESDRSVFKVQRMLVPNGKLEFADAHVALEKKSGGLNGEEFVQWLRENVFPGPEWGFYKDEGKPFFNKSSRKDSAPDTPAPAKGAKTASGKKMKRKAPANKRDNRNEIIPAQLVDADFNKARALIDSCQDKSTLKKALNLSKNLAGRGEHMRHLMRRLEQVY